MKPDKSKPMPYRTNKLDMSTQIFESMVNNLGNRLRKMDITLHFNSTNEKTAFSQALNRHEIRREQVELQSDEEGQDLQQNEEEQIIEKQIDQQGKEEVLQLEEPFEKSILLREHFMTQLNDIGSRLGVKFMVVPNKVKIRGPLLSRIDEAQQQYSQIREDIYLQQITHCGKEIYQSTTYKNLLKQHNVEIIQILKKYYFWFLKSKTSPQQILERVLKLTKHKTYKLIAHLDKQALTSGIGQVALGNTDFVRVRDRVIDNLVGCIKARLFDLTISKKLNQMQERKERHVELSDDRKSLILHLDAQQQIFIQTKNIQELYEPYQYIYFMFPKSVTMQVVHDFMKQTSPFSMKKQKNYNSDQFLWQIYQNYLCIAHLNQELSQHQILESRLYKIIQQLPNDLLNFKLVLNYFIDVPQEELWSKHFIFEKELGDKVTCIGPKNQKKIRYLELSKLYLQKKFSQQYLARLKQSKLSSKIMDNVSVSIDITNPIAETTLMINGNTFMNQTVVEKDQELQNQSNILPPELVGEKYIFRYENYAVLFVEKKEDRQKKYSDKDIQKIQKSKFPWGIQEFEKLIMQLTTFKYKFYRVKVNPEFENMNKIMQDNIETILREKPLLSVYNKWATVFSVQKQFQTIYQKDKKIKVSKIEKNYGNKQGVLCLTNLLFLFVAECNELPFGNYEVLCCLRKLD